MRNLRSYLFFVACLVAITSHGQNEEVPAKDSIASEYAESISSDSIRSYLKILASDAMQGRETGKPGQKMAAEYIAEKLENFGLKKLPTDSGYFQPFSLYSVAYDKVEIEIDNESWILFEDFYSFTTLTDTTIFSDDIVFLGYGLSTDEYDNYGDVNYEAKIGVIFEGEPRKNGISVIGGTAEPSEQSETSEKAALAREKGLSALFVVSTNFDLYLPRVADYLKEPRLQHDKPTNEKIPVIRIGESGFEKLFSVANGSEISKSLSEGKEHFDLKVERDVKLSYTGEINTVRTENVLGYVEGDRYKDEYIFLSAHYDHLGVRGSEIYNGADDDGSGVSALLEMARIFDQAASEGHRPDRSIVFAFFTAEEKGLLGSEYYTDHPVVPLESTVVDLNVDMIGRSDTRYGPDSANYIYVIGSDKLSEELHQISERVNEQYTGLTLDYHYDDPNDPQRLYYRSDHYNFAKNGIPVIFYFRGIHADYHEPTDTFEKIEFDTIENVSELIFLTAWAVANREFRIKTNF